MGVEITHDRPAAPHHAKTSECQRAGPKLGGRGGIPPRLFASGLSPRESLDPPPGTGRETYGAGSNLRHPLPPRQRLEDRFL